MISLRSAAAKQLLPYKHTAFVMKDNTIYFPISAIPGGGQPLNPEHTHAMIQVPFSNYTVTPATHPIGLNDIKKMLYVHAPRHISRRSYQQWCEQRAQEICGRQRKQYMRALCSNIVQDMWTHNQVFPPKDAENLQTYCHLITQENIDYHQFAESCNDHVYADSDKAEPDASDKNVLPFRQLRMDALLEHGFVLERCREETYTTGANGIITPGHILHAHEFCPIPDTLQPYPLPLWYVFEGNGYTDDGLCVSKNTLAAIYIASLFEFGLEERQWVKGWSMDVILSTRKQLKKLFQFKAWLIILRNAISKDKSRDYIIRCVQVVVNDNDGTLDERCTRAMNKVWDMIKQYRSDLDFTELQDWNDCMQSNVPDISEADKTKLIQIFQTAAQQPRTTKTIVDIVDENATPVLINSCMKILKMSYCAISEQMAALAAPAAAPAVFEEFMSDAWTSLKDKHANLPGNWQDAVDDFEGTRRFCDQFKKTAKDFQAAVDSLVDAYATVRDTYREGCGRPLCLGFYNNSLSKTREVCGCGTQKDRLWPYLRGSLHYVGLHWLKIHQVLETDKTTKDEQLQNMSQAKLTEMRCEPCTQNNTEIFSLIKPSELSNAQLDADSDADSDSDYDSKRSELPFHFSRMLVRVCAGTLQSICCALSILWDSFYLSRHEDMRKCVSRQYLLPAYFKKQRHALKIKRSNLPITHPPLREDLWTRDEEVTEQTAIELSAFDLAFQSLQDYYCTVSGKSSCSRADILRYFARLQPYLYFNPNGYEYEDDSQPFKELPLGPVPKRQKLFNDLQTCCKNRTFMESAREEIAIVLNEIARHIRVRKDQARFTFVRNTLNSVISTIAAKEDYRDKYNAVQRFLEANSDILIEIRNKLFDKTDIFARDWKQTGDDQRLFKLSYLSITGQGNSMTPYYWQHVIDRIKTHGGWTDEFMFAKSNLPSHVAILGDNESATSGSDSEPAEDELTDDELIGWVIDILFSRADIYSAEEDADTDFSEPQFILQDAHASVEGSEEEEEEESEEEEEEESEEEEDTDES